MHRALAPHGLTRARTEDPLSAEVVTIALPCSQGSAIARAWERQYPPVVVGAEVDAQRNGAFSGSIDPQGGLRQPCTSSPRVIADSISGTTASGGNYLRPCTLGNQFAGQR